MINDLFNKEYFNLYNFYMDSEKEFREHPFVNKITTGFCYKGGKKPVYILFSAFQSEEEALSMVEEKSLIEVLEELKQEAIDVNLDDGDYFIHLIDLKIRDIKRRNER